jgi:hypothetical protein
VRDYHGKKRQKRGINTQELKDMNVIFGQAFTRRYS